MKRLGYEQSISRAEGAADSAMFWRIFNALIIFAAFQTFHVWLPSRMRLQRKNLFEVQLYVRDAGFYYDERSFN